MTPKKRWISTVFLLGAVLFLSGCMRLSTGFPPGPRYEAYQPIGDQEAHQFIFQALEEATAEFGAPVISVNQVFLRRSLKTTAARSYPLRENFTETSCVDETNGVFAIYMGFSPDQSQFYGVLGHECAHLINAHVTDWYIEGVATVFSEQVCSKLGKDWGKWKRHFMRSRKDPYALSYRMMLELQEAFPVEYPTMIQFIVPRVGIPDWFRIDIDAWIDSLPEAQRASAMEIIYPYVKPLLKHTGVQYDFTAPSLGMDRFD